jgi:hypothetical protein
MKKKCSLTLLLLVFCLASFGQTKKPGFRVLVLYENGGHHVAYTSAAKLWLDKLAIDSNFEIDYYQNTQNINEQLLKKYQLFIQLDYPPYGWTPEAAKAFEKYIEEGRGGWVGFHHASLLGEFDGFAMWDWFSRFMGGIRWKNYIATFVQAQVDVEDLKHPVMKGVPSKFIVKKEEFYTYDKSPRPGVHVLASVDEADIGDVQLNQEVTFTVDAYQTDVFDGKVTQIRLQPTTVQNVVTYTVVIDVPNKDLKLMPGMTTNITIHVKNHKNVLKIQSKAIKYVPPTEYYLINNIPAPDSSKKSSAPNYYLPGSKQNIWIKNKDNKVSAVEVTLGISDGNYTEIMGPIKEGDDVVTESEVIGHAGPARSPFMPKFGAKKK